LIPGKHFLQGCAHDTLALNSFWFLLLPRRKTFTI